MNFIGKKKGFSTDWKKFKKENLFLNYSVILMPHSQKKPIRFNLPAWGFGLLFLLVLALTGTSLFLAGSSFQLKKVEEQKRRLETEWQTLNQEKIRLNEEYSSLQKVVDVQKNELDTLEVQTNDTLKQIEELYARESEIRSEAGLSDPEPDNAPLPSSVSATDSSGQKLERVKNNLAVLQASISNQEESFHDLSTQITAAKEAVRAEEYKKEHRRETIVSYALQFLGNPYVYGGTNPNTGADCSGFTSYVMRNSAGVSIPRTSYQQAAVGKEITADEMRPGDLIFYGNGSSVNHVAIYIGNGRIVHASTEKTGIKTSVWNYRTPMHIVNVLGD